MHVASQDSSWVFLYDSYLVLRVLTQGSHGSWPAPNYRRSVVLRFQSVYTENHKTSQMAANLFEIYFMLQKTEAL